MRLTDGGGREVVYRYFLPEDDIDLITRMLHEAYAPLAARGMRFLASHQDSATTRKRMDRGDTILALDGETIVGAITLEDVEHTRGSAFYDRLDVAGFGQFAVRSSQRAMCSSSTCSGPM